MAACDQLGKQTADDERVVIVTREKLHAFCMRCMERVGAAPAHAKAFADMTVSADYRGHFSHGLNRLEYYIEDIRNGHVVSSPEVMPVVVKETVATALVDGRNLLGPVVGTFAMDLAIRKAKEAGIGWVSVKGSNHFGIAGWYSMRALEHGLIGMAFTNTTPCLVPTRARQKALGTNPISVAAPAKDGDSFVLDMATTVVALGKVEVKHVLQQPLPVGWAVNREGKPTVDTAAVMASPALLALGGLEETCGYKGYGMAMMVEVFCGILSGASFGPFIRQWCDHSDIADLGHCFVALDPDVFAPGFVDRLSELLNHCRNLEPADGESEVLVPGDPERHHMSKCDALGGIPYKQQQLERADNIARMLGVPSLQLLK